MPDEIMIQIVYNHNPIFPHESYQDLLRALRQIGERQTNIYSIEVLIEEGFSQLPLENKHKNGRDYTGRWTLYNPQIDSKIRRRTNKFDGAGRVTNGIKTRRHEPIQINKTREGKSKPHAIKFKKYSSAIR